MLECGGACGGLDLKEKRGNWMAYIREKPKWKQI